MSASWRHRRMRSTMPHSYSSSSSSASSSISWNTSVVSFASGWRLVLVFPFLCLRGERCGDVVVRSERFGSSVELLWYDIVLELASMYVSIRPWGPKENVEPSDPRAREPDGEGIRGI